MMPKNWWLTYIPEVHFKIQLPDSDEWIEKTYLFDNPEHNAKDIALKELYEDHPNVVSWRLTHIKYRKSK